MRQIRRKNRKQYSGEEKIRTVLGSLRIEESVSEHCRREGITESMYYRWSKEFLEAGKARLVGNTKRQTTSGEPFFPGRKRTWQSRSIHGTVPGKSSLMLRLDLSQKV